MTDVLGRAVIEVGVDEMRLQDELGQAQKDMSSSFNETLKRTKLTTSEMSKMAKITGTLQYLDVNRVKLADAQTRSTLKLATATQKHFDIAKKLSALTLKERQDTRGGKTLSATMPGFGDTGNNSGVMGKLEKLFSLGGGIFGAASGMTLGAAAAAGSTTLDTLTGSLQMLGLAAGAKTQDAVLSVSRLLQNMARAVDNAPRGVVGGSGGVLGGAAVGWAFGGLPGAVAGGIGGGVVGGITEKATGDFADKRRMIGQIKANPEHVGKLLKEINELEANQPWYSFIPFTGNTVEIAKRRGAIRTFEAQNRGIAPKTEEPFKTAGLNMPASYAGLGDVRQQAQIAAVSKGPLETENWQRDMLNNLKAIAQNTAGNGTKNVAPPGS